MLEIGLIFEERKLLFHYLSIAPRFGMEWEQKFFITRLNPALIQINFHLF